MLQSTTRRPRRLPAALTFTFWLFAFTFPLFAFSLHSASAAACKVLDPELQDFYEGGCKNGLAEGEGHARGSAEYQGAFHQGMKHGRGVKTWAWGDRYEGGFANDRRNGKGIYVWGERSPWAGERYVGDYVTDQREGFGTYYWPNGDRFDGVWKQDRRYGYSAMEQRRQAAQAQRAESFVPGAQVCSWGKVGISYNILRVGKLESVDGSAIAVRLLRLEGVPEAVSASALQPGALMKGVAGDWVLCS